VSLGIHVFGPGFGESIVVDLPDGQLGIVDFFQFGSATPLKDHIARRFAGRQVAFLALTHPHADHCTGLEALLETTPIDRYWLFNGYQLAALVKYFEEVGKLRRGDAVEVALATRSSSVGSEILYLDRHLKPLLRRNSVGIACLAPSRVETLCGGEVTVEFVTPSDRHAYLYADQLAEWCRRLPLHGDLAAADLRRLLVNHNQVSGALLVQYGETCLVLMSDAEQPLWRDYLASIKGRPRRRVQLIKVSHHGSDTGFDTELYREGFDASGAVAVVTPFSRLRDPLPQKEPILGIKSLVGEVLCTNRIAAQGSTGLGWRQVSKVPRDRLPAANAMLSRSRYREFRSLLAPDFGGPEHVAKDAAVPAELVPVLRADSGLLQFLHPELRDRWVFDDRRYLLEEFHVGCYFDDRGNEDRGRREVGWGAGSLMGGRGRTARRG
jgi:hypothetical protein